MISVWFVSRIVSVTTTGVLLLSGWVTCAHAQRFQWPEKAENLQVLAKDTSGQDLRAVMRGFTRSLGVRCNDCHVGERSQPISTYDFASDANPRKDVAREMLRMLASIDDHLARIEPTEDRRVEVGCYTCHRGRLRPATLVEELGTTYHADGIAAAIAQYRSLRAEFRDRGAYDFSIESLNQFGYELLPTDAEGAVAVFTLNTEMFPESANAWDSLGEAHAAAGRPEVAVLFYERSLTLDPANENALEMIRKLRGASEEVVED